VNNKPNVAIIGYGFAGRAFHSYLISLEPRLHLSGIASRNPETREKIRSDWQCHAYESLDEVLADEAVDLVIIASPNYAHAEQTIAALNAGKHVVTDKVMALNLADCDAMIEASKRNNKMLTVFQNRRWDGDFLTLKTLIAQGADGPLGTVKWVELAWQGLGNWGGWRGEREKGGGRFFDLGAHLVDQLAHFFPTQLESVYARITHDFPHSTVDSESLIIANFAGGYTGIADLSSRTAVSKPRFLAHGDKATFAKYGLDPQEKAMIAKDIDSAVESEEAYGKIVNNQGETIIPTQAGRWRSFYENIADVLIDGAEPAVSLESVRRQIQIMDAAQTSATTGQTVKF
jgi:scyllo-inositol 2-dehydrogenase (NADP+)